MGDTHCVSTGVPVPTVHKFTHLCIRVQDKFVRRRAVETCPVFYRVFREDDDDDDDVISPAKCCTSVPGPAGRAWRRHGRSWPRSTGEYDGGPPCAVSSAPYTHVSGQNSNIEIPLRPRSRRVSPIASRLLYRRVRLKTLTVVSAAAVTNTSCAGGFSGQNPHRVPLAGRKKQIRQTAKQA